MEQRQARIRKPRQAKNQDQRQQTVPKPAAPETKKPVGTEVASTPAESKPRLWSEIVKAAKNPKTPSPVQVEKRVAATEAINAPKVAAADVASSSPTSEQNMKQTLKRGARQGGRDKATKTLKNLKHEEKRELCKVNVHHEEKDSNPRKGYKYTLRQLDDTRSALEAAQLQVQNLKRQQADRDEQHLKELSQASDDFRKELCEQDERFKNQLATQMERIERELADRREIQMQQLSRKEENHSKDLFEQEVRFKKEFADLEDNMNKQLSDLEESYRNVFSELEEKLKKKVAEEEANLKQQLLEEEANLKSVSEMEEEQKDEEEIIQPQEVPMEEGKKKKGFWKGFWTRLFQRKKKTVKYSV